MRERRLLENIKYFGLIQPEIIADWVEQFAHQWGEASCYSKNSGKLIKFSRLEEFTRCVLNQQSGEILICIDMGDSKVEWLFTFRKRLLLEIEFGRKNRRLTSQVEEKADKLLNDLLEWGEFDLAVGPNAGDWKKLQLEGNLVGLYFWEKLYNECDFKKDEEGFASNDFQKIGNILLDLVKNIRKNLLEEGIAQARLSMDASSLKDWVRGIDDLMVEEINKHSNNELYNDPEFEAFLKVWLTL
ncbi:MAG: hypothetical protein QM496_05315 [Verrucomicrobiota bacterium]